MANFIYDAFQKQAIDAIDHGDSVIVSSPTGSGKTAIAEHVINLCIKKGQGVIYTAPIKALSNQKFRDFENLYGDKVGILTGDVSINPFGQLLIMTTEIFRNKALVEPASLAQYHWIIFDEIHYLDDPERGSVWEESIMFLPEQMKILCLSATIPNINELAGWIEYVHKKPLKRIIEDKRPVPLHFFFQCQGEIIAEWKKLKSSYQQAKASYFYRGRRFAKHPNLKPNRLSSLVNYLQKSNKLPVIYFAFGRKRCAELAWELSQANFLEADEQKKAITEFDRLCQRYELTAEKSAQEIAALVEKGIAFHHAGMLPTLKEVVERLFTARLIKVIFTTETFALGINMPARSVCFDALRKFYGVYHRNLKTRDFYQMAGRAGRRGMDKEGFVFLRLNPHLIDLKEVERILYGQPEKVNSQFNSSYATLLHLYKQYGEKLYDIYPRSFHYYQEKPLRQKKAVDLIKAKVNLLKESLYIEQERLTPKGEFSSSVFGYELMLGQFYEDNLLEQLSETELAILACALVYEPRKQEEKLLLKGRFHHLASLCEKTFAKIDQLEKKYRIWPKTKPAYFHLAELIEAWVQGNAFSKLLRLSEIDEGEIVRNFRMAVQILREVREAALFSQNLKEKLVKVIKYINRDVVDAEKQLREG